MKTLESPKTLSQKSSGVEFEQPAYDWEKQTRHDTIVGGMTSSTKQTFKSNGTPYDSTSDPD